MVTPGDVMAPGDVVAPGDELTPGDVVASGDVGAYELYNLIKIHITKFFITPKLIYC